MKIKKVIIVINQGKQHAKKTARTLKEILDRARVRQQWLGVIPRGKRTYESLRQASARSADLIIACGGDGTLLQTAHRFRGSGVPILGINIGYLGFITSVEGGRVKQEMHRILEGAFVVSERTALDLAVHKARAKP